MFESTIPTWPGLEAINVYYEQMSNNYMVWAHQSLYKQAVEDKRLSDEELREFHSYGTNNNYTLAYNRDCIASLIFDDYVFTGGAHGTTYRQADNWNITNGTRFKLSDFFPDAIDYKKYLLNHVLITIKEQMANGEGAFFIGDMESLEKVFDEKYFYVTNEGLIIYFQQYEIGPYALGIPTFLIPYAEGIIELPECQ
jgi:hypothetical protein